MTLLDQMLLKLLQADINGLLEQKEVEVLMVGVVMILVEYVLLLMETTAIVLTS